MRSKLFLALGLTLLVSGSTVLAGGCSSAPAATEDAGSGKKLCTAGSYVFCRCASGEEATKLCNDDGETFGPCALGENKPCGEQPDPNTGDSAVPQPTADSSIPPTPAAEACDGQNIALSATSEITISGDTTAAKDDTKGQNACAGGNGAPDHVYALTVPTTGRLTATVVADAKFAPIAYLRTACADEAAQSACAAGLAPGQSAVVSTNVIKGRPYFVVVDGAAGPNQAGKYTLKLKLDPGGFCGDGEATGDTTAGTGEVCDDINKVADDGCSNDCRNFNGNPDSGKSCPGQPVHVWGTTTVSGTGTTTGFPSTWTGPGNDCSAVSTVNVAEDHLYAVTAHRTGTMTVSTTGASFNVILSARRTCMDATTQGAGMCANNNGSSAPLDETMSFPVTSGTTYYVGVSGAVGADGNYTLSFRIP